MQHKTEAFTAQVSEFYLSDGADFDMPDAVGMNNYAFAVKNIGESTITGTPIEGQTVDEQNSHTIEPGKWCQYVGDGENWFSFNN